MQLPDSFIHTIRTTFAEDGERFIAALPSLIEEASERWDLKDVQSVPNLTYNFVAFAKRVPVRPTSMGYSTTKQDVILKMGVPNPEQASEMAALRLFNGEGACQLLDYDEEKGFLLLERLKPGTMLSELEDDDERTHIAIDVMKKIWRPLESSSLLLDVEQQAVRLQKFIKLSDWFDGLKNIRLYFNGGTGPIPREILERVESSLPELFADDDIRLIHGDFHHYNILSSERGWLAIDPKGVIGPAGYEIGPLMLNPWNSFSDRTSFQVKTERRIDILRERLGWEREKIVGWALAHSVLSAYWDIELDPAFRLKGENFRPITLSRDSLRIAKGSETI